MNSTVLYKTRCPNCAKDGKDKHGDNLAYYSDGHSYCYSCGFHTRTNTKKLKQPKVKQHQDLYLPQDLTEEIPAEPLQWLQKYWEYQDIPKNIYWSSSESKLYFLLFINDILVATNARYFGDNPKHPKWIHKGVSENLFYIEGSKATSIVLVEDIISCIKVGKVLPCMCLFGSNISAKRLISLSLLGYKEIIIWLDPDKTKESIKFQAIGQSLGINVISIFTDKDPKEYTTEEIKGLLT